VWVVCVAVVRSWGGGGWGLFVEVWVSWVSGKVSIIDVC